MDFVTLVELVMSVLGALVGFPALVSVAVTALEYYKVLAVEKADMVIFWANAVAFVGVFVLAVMGKLDLVNQIDSTFGQLAQLATYVLILLGVPIGFAITKASHTQLRSARFLGLLGHG